MKITFLGAAKTVTGSNFLVETAGKKFLVDCGMYQGKVTHELENTDPFLYDVNDIDFMILTHAHIDHSGRIPKLYNEGFRGPVYATKATCDLCEIMLPDSGHIQEVEIVWKNKKRIREGKDEIPPLYTAEEAETSSRNKLREEIGILIRNLRENSVHAGAYLKQRLDETAVLLEGSLQDLKQVKIHMTKARELLALTAVLKGRPEPLVLRGVPPTEKIFRDRTFNAASAVPFRISAAGNERESFQIVAFPDRKMTGVTASARALSGPDGTEIPAKNVQINPVGYIELENSTAYSSSRNGFWPEVLQHNRPLDLADCLQPYWITVYVPSGQKAGVYRGTVDFSMKGKNPCPIPL